LLSGTQEKVLVALKHSSRQREDVKVVQELLRHSSSKMTLDVYAQALTPAKRAT
jgi:integrase